jgi:hypothetical protein
MGDEAEFGVAGLHELKGLRDIVAAHDAGRERIEQAEVLHHLHRRCAIGGGVGVGDGDPLEAARGRLFGAEPPPTTTVPPGEVPRSAEASGGLVSSFQPGQQGMGSITGTRGRGAVQELNPGAGFTASFSVSQQRQRPPSGDARVVESNPQAECASLLGLPTYDFCILQAEQRALTDAENGNNGTAGGTFFRVPPTTSVGIQTQFKLTPRWSAGWNTTYDVERSRFAAQVVTLQRELHDWRAVFGFTQAPNGNVGFTFYVALKAQPDLKLDYDRRSYRQPTGQIVP